MSHPHKEFCTKVDRKLHSNVVVLLRIVYLRLLNCDCSDHCNSHQVVNVEHPLLCLKNSYPKIPSEPESKAKTRISDIINIAGNGHIQNI